MCGIVHFYSLLVELCQDRVRLRLNRIYSIKRLFEQLIGTSITEKGKSNYTMVYKLLSFYHDSLAEVAVFGIPIQDQKQLEI